MQSVSWGERQEEADMVGRISWRAIVAGLAAAVFLLGLVMAAAPRGADAASSCRYVDPGSAGRGSDMPARIGRPDLGFCQR